MPQNDGWNVVSTTPAAQDDGWNVVSTTPAQQAPVHINQPRPQGLLSSFADTSGASMVGHILRHPIDTAADVIDAGKQVFTPSNANKPLSASSNPILKGIGDTADFTSAAAHRVVNDLHNGGASNPHLGDDVMESIPLAGQVYQKATSQADAGNTRGAVGSLLGFGAGLLAPEGMEAAKAKLPAVRDAALSPLRSGVDEPLPGTSLTPRQRYQSAQRLGVQLDAADATNSPMLTMTKAVNRDRLVSAPTYDAAKAQNLTRLGAASDELVNGMSPDASLQSRGATVQNDLRRNQQGLRDAADSGFSYLDEMTGGAPVPGASDVGKFARNLLDEQQPFFTKYPSLEPGTPTRILKDLAKVDDTSSYGDLQRLRSGTFEVTKNNPDLVKDEGTSWLQQATSRLDGAITDKGLTPDQAAVFRDSNANWKDLKSTYDDPSSPFYSAVRNATPESLADGVGSPSGSNVQKLFARIGPDAQGAVRRTVAENLLGSNSTGDAKFQGFGQRLFKLDDGYRDALFSPEQNQQLDDIANTTHALNSDLNPSGTAKMVGKIADFHTLGPAALYELGRGNVPGAVATAATPLLHYPLARLINSPRFTEMLMREPGAAGSAGGILPPPVAGSAPSNQPSAPAAPASSAPLARLGLNAKPSAEAPATPQAAPVQPRPFGSSLEGLNGANTQLHTPSGMLPARYRVVEADSLTPSHNASNFRPNPAYPEGVQERDYLGQRENQLRVVQNAQNYRPELTITDNPDGVNGPPVVTPDGIVLGGNSRTMATQRLYANDGAAYRDMLLNKAPAFGLSPEAIGAMQKPMLVREVSPSGGTEGLRRLGSDLNKPLTGAMSGSEKAVSMGKSVSAKTLSAVQGMIDEAGGDATLREVMSDPRRSNSFLQKMQEDGLITSSERPQFVDTATGGLTEDGKRLFERALLGSAIGDSALMDSAPKNVLQKLNASIGPLSSIGARGDEWNIMPEIQRAIQEHASMQRRGMGVDDYLKHPDMFAAPMNGAEEQMVRLLAQGPNAVRDALASYAKDAKQSPEGQSSMFGGPTPEDSWIRAFGPFQPQVPLGRQPGR